MSSEQAKAAIDKVKTDSAFRNKVMAISDVSKRIQFLNDSGFKCTLEEITKLTKLDSTLLITCSKVVINLDPSTLKA